jgi:two-component system cell cycle sensor histidine kinase/response regulator CckA
MADEAQMNEEQADARSPYERVLCLLLEQASSPSLLLRGEDEIVGSSHSWSCHLPRRGSLSDLVADGDLERLRAALSSLEEGEEREVRFCLRSRRGPSSGPLLGTLRRLDAELCLLRLRSWPQFGHDEEGRNRLLVEHAPFALYVNDLQQRRVLYVNERMLELHGVLHEAATDLYGLIHPEDRAWLESEQPRQLESGYAEQRYRIVRPDGEVRWVRDLFVVVPDAAGEPLYQVGYVADITDELAFEEHLRRSQRLEAVEQMAGSVAHNFNNLTTVILATVDSVLRQRAGGKKRDEERLRERLGVVKKAAEQAAAITSQLRNFSRSSVLSLRRASPAALIAEAAAMASEIYRPEVELRVSPAPTRPVLVDESQLQQVLLNLLLNAHEAIPGAGTVEIACFSTSLADGRQAVAIAVSDDGVGIAEEDVERIFEPFYTSNPRWKSGLGLASAFGIVRQAGGSIEVSSTLGVGSTFTVLLPAASEMPTEDGGGAPAEDAAAEPPQALGEAKPAQADSARRLRFAVVEDDAVVRSVIVELLEELGFSVAAQYEDGQRALVGLRSDPVDVVVTDALMPALSGFELARALLREQAQVKLLIVSGYTREVDEELPPDRCLFLEKPFVADELAEVLERLLDAGAEPRE